MSKNDEPTKKLSAKQRAAVAALMSGATQAEAAAAADVAPKTVWRWLSEDSTFNDAIKERSAAALSDARRLLVSNLETAVVCMVEIINSDKPPAGSGVRLRAAKLVIDSALRLVETNDILDRLDAIEIKINWGDREV